MLREAVTLILGENFVRLRGILASYGWGYGRGTLGDCFSMRTCVIVVLLRGILATYGWGYGHGTRGDCFSMRTCVILVMLRGILASYGKGGFGRDNLGTAFP
jgi:hypothetical protein